MNREEIINTAYKYAKDGKFSVQASYCDNSVPDVEIKAYEERAWLLIKNVSLEKLDESYNLVLLAGMEEDDMTSEELLRYIGSYAQSDYDNLAIEQVVFWSA